MIEDWRQPPEYDDEDPQYSMSEEEYNEYLDNLRQNQEEQGESDRRDEYERSRYYL